MLIIKHSVRVFACGIVSSTAVHVTSRPATHFLGHDPPVKNYWPNLASISRAQLFLMHMKMPPNDL